MKIAFIVALITLVVSCRSNLESVQDIQISGTVDSLYISWNHAVETMVVNNRHIGLISWLDWDSTLWEYIEVGDSVNKPMGSTTLRVVKKGGEYRDFRYMMNGSKH